MLNHLKSEANIAYTENGAVTNASTMSDCLDLFAGIGALRAADDQEIIRRFVRAYAEDADIAMKILFFGRDVRGGLGERRVFRVIINWLAENRAESLRKNIELIPEFGRYDDLVSLIGTACEKDALRTIRKQLEADLASDAEVSLLAKWLPSVNASNAETVRKAKRIARYPCHSAPEQAGCGKPIGDTHRTARACRLCGLGRSIRVLQGGQSPLCRAEGCAFR